MTPQTSDTIGAIVCVLVALLLLAWGRRERRKERAAEQVPLCDRIAATMAHDLDDEWRRLATLPARDWPVA